VHHRTLSGADFFPSLAKPTVGGSKPLAHRTLSGAHRTLTGAHWTVWCPLLTIGSATRRARITRPTVGRVDSWLTGQSGEVVRRRRSPESSQLTDASLPRRPRAALARPRRAASRPHSPAAAAPPSPWRLGPARPVRLRARRGSLPGAACSPARPQRGLGGARAAPAPGVASAVRAEPRRDPCTHGVPASSPHPRLAAVALGLASSAHPPLRSAASARRGFGSRGRGAPA
jgi:hypothetical protein